MYVTDTQSKVPEKPKFLKRDEWLSISLGENTVKQYMKKKQETNVYLTMKTLMFEKEKEVGSTHTKRKDWQKLGQHIKMVVLE